MMKRYAEIKAQIALLRDEMLTIESELLLQVEKTGEIAGHGFRAYMKPGRKSIKHQAAVDAAFEEYTKHQMHS